MNDKITMPCPPSLETGHDTARDSHDALRRVVPPILPREKVAARKKAFDLILLDALRGSRDYVESYRAGRGAE
jgi:hypothetical protein